MGFLPGFWSLGGLPPDWSIAPLPAYAATLYFDDITSELNDWRNRSYTNYFHKKGIVLAPPAAR